MNAALHNRRRLQAFRFTVGYPQLGSFGNSDACAGRRMHTLLHFMECCNCPVLGVLFAPKGLMAALAFLVLVINAPARRRLDFERLCGRSKIF
jgi:hypothetical protein